MLQRCGPCSCVSVHCRGCVRLCEQTAPQRSSFALRHIADVEGDGAGYDVLSFQANGAPKYIGVKTTRGSMDAAFFMSANELAFARQHPANYYLYRVYDYDAEASTGNVYVVSGVPGEGFDITPTQYRIRPT